MPVIFRPNIEKEITLETNLLRATDKGRTLLHSR